MASIIRIKRSGVSAAPSELKLGEIAYSYFNGEAGGDRLYIGTSGESADGNALSIDVIGGKYYTDKLNHTPGTLTTNSAIIIDSDGKIDRLLVDNIEINGNNISTTNTNGNINLLPSGTGTVSVNNKRITLVADPTGATDAVNLRYFQSTIGTGAVSLKIVDEHGESDSIVLIDSNFIIRSGVGTVVNLTNNGFRVKLADTTVNAGTYGTSTAIPSFVVDSQGRLTSVSNIDVEFGIDSSLVSNLIDSAFNVKSTDNLSEGSTNLYYSRARVDSDINSLVFDYSGFDSDFSTKTTTNLSEGSNLYYTKARVDSDVLNQIDSNYIQLRALPILDEIDSNYIQLRALPILDEIDSNYIQLRTLSYSGFDSDFSSKSTTDLTEGTNLYYTTARFESDLGDITTDDVTEGSNLYFTYQRVRDTIGVQDNGGDGSLTWNSSTGQITYVGPSSSEVRAHFSGGTGVAITNGVVSIGQAVGTSDDVTFQNLEVSGLTVTGTQTVINTNTLSVQDPLIQLAKGNDSADILDIGFIGNYSDDGGSNVKHTGLFRDASNNDWYLFDNLIDSSLDSVSPSSFINRSQPSFRLANLHVGTLIGTYTGFDSDFAQQTIDALTEGSTNLFYTSTRVDSDFDARLATKTTTDVAEGTNLYYTTSRADSDFDVRLATKTTTNVAEGNNLYYTTARHDSDTLSQVTSAYVQARQDYAYGSLTGVPTNISSFANDTNFLDSNTVTDVIDAAYVQARQITYDFLDSAEVTALVNTAYVQARQDYAYSSLTGAPNVLDSADVSALISSLSTDSAAVFLIVDSAYVQSRQITYDFLDTAEVTALVNTAYVRARQDYAYNSLTGKPTALSDFTNDIGFTQYSSTEFDSDFGTKTTTDLSEGSNLYFTYARVRSTIGVQDNGGDGSLAYNSSTGQITYTGPSASEVRAHLSGGIGITYNSSTGVISLSTPIDSAIIEDIVDEAYIQARDRIRDSNFVTLIVDSAYVAARSAPTLTVQQVDSADNVEVSISNVQTINFDNYTGFNVTDEGSGTVKVALGSGFKTIQVDGDSDLVATGEDTLKVVAGNGIVLATNASANPQELSVAVDSDHIAEQSLLSIECGVASTTYSVSDISINCGAAA